MISKYLGIACAALLAACAALSWNTLRQAQEIGAYQENAKRDRNTLAVERAKRDQADASLLQHQTATRAAQARAAHLDRKLQEAQRHDPKTQEWAAVCGARELPCVYREWLLGHLPAECVDRDADPEHLSPADTDTSRSGSVDGRASRVLQADARGP